MKLDFLQRCAGLLTLGIATVSFGADYVITDLGPGSGVAINNSGAVVRNSGTNAFFYRNGTVTQIRLRRSWQNAQNQTEFTEALEVNAVDVNDGGVVVGGALSTENAYAFWWTESASKIQFSYGWKVRRINNSGFATSLDFLDDWPSAQVSQFYPDAGNDGYSFEHLLYHRGELLGINNANVLVGYATTEVPGRPGNQPMARAVRVVGGVETFLDSRSPGGSSFYLPDPATRLSEAFAINEGGTVVGRMAVAPLGPKHAFRYVDGTGMEDLGTLGGVVSEALDVNDPGVIVGHSQVADGQWRAFVYENGSMMDLNSLLPAGVNVVLLRANRINNVGQIVGDMLVNGATNAFVLSPPSLITAPQIVEQPTSQRLAIGQTAVLQVSAIGALPLRYQWWKGTEPLANQTNASLTLSNVNAFAQETYRVEVSNSGGSVSSSTATLTVLDPELTPYTMAALSIVGEVGGNYRIEFKPDAHGQNWQPLATIQLTNNPQWFIDVESTTNRSRIYRSIRQP